MGWLFAICSVRRHAHGRDRDGRVVPSHLRDNASHDPRVPSVGPATLLRGREGVPIARSARHTDPEREPNSRAPIRNWAEA